LDTDELPEKRVSLWVEPQGIDFGNLRPGRGANATLQVAGGPGQVVVHSDRLTVTPVGFGLESTELQLTLAAGAAGELMWDDILLQANTDELKVLVTARWEELGDSTPDPEPASVSMAVLQPAPSKPLPPVQREEEQKPKAVLNEDEGKKRTFKGRKCRWCGKNIYYDTNSRSWKACKSCRGARMPLGLMLRLSREFYLGTKELRPALTEIWETLIGKEGQRGTK
jgi:hypothetical protein